MVEARGVEPLFLAYENLLKMIVYAQPMHSFAGYSALPTIFRRNFSQTFASARVFSVGDCFDFQQFGGSFLKIPDIKLSHMS